MFAFTEAEKLELQALEDASEAARKAHDECATSEAALHQAWADKWRARDAELSALDAARDAFYARQRAARVEHDEAFAKIRDERSQAFVEADKAASVLAARTHVLTEAAKKRAKAKA